MSSSGPRVCCYLTEGILFLAEQGEGIFFFSRASTNYATLGGPHRTLHRMTPKKRVSFDKYAVRVASSICLRVPEGFSEGCHVILDHVAASLPPADATLPSDGFHLRKTVFGSGAW